MYNMRTAITRHWWDIQNKFRRHSKNRPWDIYKTCI